MKKDNHTEKNSAGYAGGTNHTEQQRSYSGSIIDLGLATSPIGPAPELLDMFEQHIHATSQAMAEYSKDPYHTATKQTLLNGIGLQGITTESVIFHPNGSYGAGDEMIRHLATRGFKTLTAPVYSFPNTAQWAERNRVAYKPLPGDTLDPSSSLQAVLKMGKRDLSRTIVYIDYPNNPTGIANPVLIRQVVEHVLAHGGVPIVDLAFGEVLGEEFRDAMQFTLDHGGIVLSSLSKTQGLPSLRAGYAIMSDKITHDYTKSERLVFGLSPEAELAYQTLYSLDSGGTTLAQIQAERAATYNAQVNGELAISLNTLGLRIASTDSRVPIQVIISNLPDFHERLAQQGIITESLVDYRITLNLRRIKRGYGDAAVRILTPRPGQISEVLKRTKLALQ